MPMPGGEYTSVMTTPVDEQTQLPPNQAKASMTL
jgi:hypothetical protein